VYVKTKKMMKKIFMLLCTLAITALALPAQDQKLRVAVFDPTSSGTAIDEGTKMAVREIISSTFVNTGKYTIVERSLLDKVMKEQAFSNTDMVDESQATELGRLAGANKVVLSVVTLVGGRNMLSVKVIDVQTATVDQQKTRIVSSNDLLDAVEPLTLELMGEEVPATAPDGQAAKTPSASAQVKTAQATDCGCDVQAEDAMQGMPISPATIIYQELTVRAENKVKTRTFDTYQEALNSFCPEGWRAPTFTELQCMYREKDKIGGFDRGNYYSSKFTHSFATLFFSGINFKSGKERAINGYRKANLRCVRDK
jgi:hypothetical protein